jgi:hypothetical protein
MPPLAVPVVAAPVVPAGVPPRLPLAAPRAGSVGMRLAISNAMLRHIVTFTGKCVARRGPATAAHTATNTSSQTEYRAMTCARHTANRAITPWYAAARARGRPSSTNRVTTAATASLVAALAIHWPGGLSSACGSVRVRVYPPSARERGRGQLADPTLTTIHACVYEVIRASARERGRGQLADPTLTTIHACVYEVIRVSFTG